MDVPSCSYVKSLRLSIDPLNTLQSNVFLNDHDDFFLTFDESPTRFVQNHIDLMNDSLFLRNQKVLAVGAYSQDGNFNVLGYVIASGNNWEDVLSDVQKVLRQYEMVRILRKAAG